MLVSQYPKEVQVFFVEIVQIIKETLNPDYILIAGSFGKDSWLYDNQELISDFEFVFICQKRWSFNKKKQLLKKLNNNYSFEISLKGFLSKNVSNKVISNYALKNPGYLSLDFYDTFSDPKFLYSKNNHNFEIDCKAEEIPVWEAWRLYVNRIGDILKLENSKQYDKKISDYYWLKIFESTADAYIIVKNIYSKNISKRLVIFDKELIENDDEITEICKKSFPLIKQALLAREQHNLSLFKISISIEDRKEIIISWLDYFEKKLSEKENILVENTDDFYDKYLKNKKLQKKYFGFNYSFNTLISNAIRLIFNSKLLNFKFKFYNNNYSWRHTILLSVSSVFREHCSNIQNFPKTKQIFSQLVSRKSINNLSDIDFVNTILNYWKILR